MRFEEGYRNASEGRADNLESDHGILQRLQPQCQYDLPRPARRRTALALRLENRSSIVLIERSGNQVTGCPF